MLKKNHYVEKERCIAVCTVFYTLCVGEKEYNIVCVCVYICIDYFWKNIQETGMVVFRRGN